jgi:hypothetical protein
MLPQVIDSLEPLVSFGLIADGETKYLSFVCHHALYDGVAIDVLLEEVEDFYSQKPLPSAPLYDDFLQASTNLPLTTDGFWQQHLAEFTPTLTTCLKSTNTNSSSSLKEDVLPVSLQKVMAKTQQLNVTLLGVCQTAWATVLATLLCTDDVCFGNVLFGRALPMAHIDRLVAPCFNTLPVRLGFKNKPLLSNVLEAFQDLNPSFIEHQFTPLRRIQHLVSWGERRPLFDTLLLVQPASRTLDERIWRLEKDEGEMDVSDTIRWLLMFTLTQSAMTGTFGL